MRSVFLFQRLLGYGVIFVALFWHGAAARPWWQWILSVAFVAWGSWDQWKKPTEQVPVMRRGVWVETVCVLIWALVMQNNVVLFLLISPLARAGVHLGWRDSVWLALTHVVCVVGGSRMYPNADWMPIVQVITLVSAGGYSLVLGELVRQRDRLARIVKATAMDREQRLRDEERIRIAGLLHDSMGQHWTAVVRALDVAEQVDGEPRLLFVSKAREAALQGLQEMRAATHDWYQGRQTPTAWMNEAERSLERLREFIGLQVQFTKMEVAWPGFSDKNAVAEVIARTVMEGSTNAVRHGFATRLWISLQADEREVRLIVRDNGRGIEGYIGREAAGDGLRQRDRGMGLDALQRLARQVGGKLQIDTARGEGTTVLLVIPYEAERAGQLG